MIPLSLARIAQVTGGTVGAAGGRDNGGTASAGGSGDPGEVVVDTDCTVSIGVLPGRREGV